MAEQILRRLVECYDPGRVSDEQHNEIWQEIVAAQQNRVILQAEMIGIEHKLGEPCGVVQMGRIRGYIPLKESGCDTIGKLRQLIGTNVAFRVLNYDLENDVFTASRKQALEQMASIT